MSQHDFDLVNAAGASFRADANLALVALASRSSGASAPSTTYAYQLWVDTTTGTVKRRNAANSGWIVEGTIDEARFVSRSSNTILDVSDIGKVFRATSSFTQTLDAVATLGDGWFCDYIVASGVTTVFDPNSAEQIDGATTLSVTGPAGLRIFCDGSALRTNYASAAIPSWTISASRASNAETITVTPDAGLKLRFRSATLGTGTYDEVSATSALTLTLSSGSTLGMVNDITSRIWFVVFNDAGTLRLGAVNQAGRLLLTSDLLFSSTAEGGAGGADSAAVIYTGTAVTSKAMVIVGYNDYALAAVGTWNTAPSKTQIFSDGMALPSGSAVVLPPVATTSGTTVEITGLPAGIKEIAIPLNGVSTNGISSYLLQTGDSGGYETSGYTSLAASSVNTGGENQGTSTAGFILRGFAPEAAQLVYGTIFLTLENSVNNTWSCVAIMHCTTGTQTTTYSSGVKALSGVLDRIRLTTVGGTDTFDAGEIGLSYKL